MKAVTIPDGLDRRAAGLRQQRRVLRRWKLGGVARQRRWTQAPSTRWQLVLVPVLAFGQLELQQLALVPGQLVPPVKSGN